MQELEIVREKIQNKYRVVKTDEDLEWNRAIDLCTNIINAHMKHMNDGWIPVEERMPEDGTYLCTLKGELCGIEEPFTGMCGIENGIWDEPDCVIAWRPIPEPYQPEREGEKNPNETQANRA